MALTLAGLDTPRTGVDRGRRLRLPDRVRRLGGRGERRRRAGRARATSSPSLRAGAVERREQPRQGGRHGAAGRRRAWRCWASSPIAHALTVAVRRQRRPVGVLRAVGFVRGPGQGGGERPGAGLRRSAASCSACRSAWWWVAGPGGCCAQSLGAADDPLTPAVLLLAVPATLLLVAAGGGPAGAGGGPHPPARWPFDPE